MPTFNFKGRNNEGSLIQGARLAQTSDTLAEQLLKEGVVPFEIQEVVPEVTLKKQLLDFFVKKRINLSEMSTFARQMNTLYSSGVPLTVALKQLAKTVFNPYFSQILLNIVEDLEAGKDFASSMEKYPAVFSPLMVGMVRIGQNSGRLDEAFLSLHEYLEMELNAKKQIKTTLRYPMFVLITLFVAVIIIVNFVIPVFANVFSQAHVKLPMPTQFLLFISNFFRAHWFLTLFTSGVIAFAIYFYLNTVSGRENKDKFFMGMPLFGPIIQKIFLLRFLQAFSMIVKSGIPIVEGLNLIAESIQNEYAKKMVQKMHDEIQRGKTLYQSAVNITLFTPLEMQMIAVSEETGELGGALEHLVKFYQREVDYNLRRLNDIIEPLLVIIVSLLVLGLALVVYLPIWNLIALVH